MEEEITLHNVGPIEELVIRCPVDGGIALVEGANGAGKSLALEAVESLLTNNGRPVVRDHAQKATVSGLGVTLSVAARASRRGQLSASIVETKHTMHDLVDPPIKDPVKADALGIRVLAQLAGEEPDIGRFHNLLGDRALFEQFVAIPPDWSGDFLALAETVRRELHAAARRYEHTAETERARAAAQRELADKLPAETPHDQAALSAALEAAIGRLSSLEERARADLAAKLRADEARQKLAALDVEHPEQAVTAASERLQVAERAVRSNLERIAALTRELESAQQEELALRRTAEDARRAVASAEKLAHSVAGWRAAIEGAAAQPVSAAEIEAATQARNEARTALETGALVRECLAAADNARAAVDAAETAAGTAEQLRSAATGVDGVLTEVVAKLGSPLRVEAGRLVVTTDRGKDEFYRELSFGERALLVVDIWCERAGPLGVFCIPQELWEGLDGRARVEIVRRLKRTGAVAITAQCTRDPEAPGGLRTITYTPEDAAP